MLKELIVGLYHLYALETLRSIAETQATAGDKSGARNTLAQALHTVWAIEDAATRAQALRDIAGALSRTK